MTRIKIFTGNCLEHIQNDVNRWLGSNRNICLLTLGQSESRSANYWNLTILVTYSLLNEEE